MKTLICFVLLFAAGYAIQRWGGIALEHPVPVVVTLIVVAVIVIGLAFMSLAKGHKAY